MDSQARSGCGMRPNTLPSLLIMPPMLFIEPFGFDSRVVRPSSSQYRKIIAIRKSTRQDDQVDVRANRFFFMPDELRIRLAEHVAHGVHRVVIAIRTRKNNDASLHERMSNECRVPSGNNKNVGCISRYS